MFITIHSPFDSAETITDAVTALPITALHINIKDTRAVSISLCFNWRTVQLITYPPS